jgi:hypothetical protein
MFSEQNDLICKAFVQARSKLRNPHRDSQAARGKYAKLEAIVALVNPILVDHGLTFTQTVKCTANHMRVRTTLIHESGQTMFTDSAPMQFGDKPTPQTIGGLTTYAKRYGLLAMLGIEHDLDDDGQTAMEAFIGGDDPEDAPKPKGKAKSKTPAKAAKLEIKAEPEPPKAPEQKTIDALAKKIAAGDPISGAIQLLKSKGLVATPDQMKILEAAVPNTGEAA